jgi:hypothetical protein
LLRKAERSIAAAETLATTQPEFAASRAYYWVDRISAFVRYIARTGDEVLSK